MVYEVLMDGQEIYDPTEKETVLLEPKLEMEVNTAGSFDFTMPPGHFLYDGVKLLTSDVEVYEGGVLLWFGRPVEIKTDFYKQKNVYCEGAMAFFNDSVQDFRLYREISVHEFFESVVECHNKQVAENRQFTVGEITVPDKTVYRKVNYEQTIDVLNRQCLSAEGGYFFFRKEDGINYIDWLAEMPYSCSQPIEFGLNLLSIGSSVGGTQIATCVLPLGEDVEETGEPLTVESVNDGSPVIESEAVEIYGRITKAVTFSGVVKPQTLLEDGIEYLRNLQFDRVSIECSAAELHFINPNYEMFRVGQTVRCVSRPHLVDRELPLLRMSLALDTAAKEITLGSLQETDLTEIVAEQAEDVEELKDDVEDTEEYVEQEDFDELEDQVEAIQEEWDDYKEDLDGISEAAEKYTELTEKYDDFTSTYDDYKDKVDDISEKYDDFTSSYDDYKESMDTYGQDISDLKEQVDALSEGGTAGGWKHWIGTQKEYDAVTKKDENTVYLIEAEV